MHYELEILTRIINIREMLFSEVRRKFSQAGLTNTEIMILYDLKHRRKEAKASELAADLYLPMSTLTGIIDKMVERNIVLRERNEEDRRVVTIKLNPDFERESEKHMNVLNSLMKDVLSGAEDKWILEIQNNLKYLEELLGRRVATDE